MSELPDDFEVRVGDALAVLRDLPDGCVQTCVTSPPYWGLRDYGVDGQLGLEPTPDEYVENLVAVFGEVRRVLREDGTLWLNLGDSYVSSTQTTGRNEQGGRHSDGGGPFEGGERTEVGGVPSGLKEKDLTGIPWRVAFALQEDGWWLRSDIIWCLSGGTKVYARTQKGVTTAKIKDLVRLDPSAVELWNGEQWTQVLGWNESPRPNNPLEIELRSGERIGCTPDHRWPLADGSVVKASELEVGDVLCETRLPEPDDVDRPRMLPSGVGWLVGYYIAEGSRDGRGRVQFSSHTDEDRHASHLREIVEALGGNLRRYTDGNTAQMRVSGPVVGAVLDQYVGGRTAKTKHLANACWQRSDAFLRYLIDGYLAGDGHYDEENDRWRLGFTENDSLASDLRTICGRLDMPLRLTRTTHENNESEHPGWTGTVRTSRSDHHNARVDTEIVSIRRSRARKFYDIGVADEPHTFALASGVLTHNSKPNPMPESVTDRPTNAHEHIFLLSKSERYYYDHEAIKEPIHTDPGENYPDRAHVTGRGEQGFARARGNDRDKSGGFPVESGRNKRDVWTVTTKPYPDAHFAVYPPDLIFPCIKAGSDTGDLVLDPFCGAGTTGVVCTELGRRFLGIELNERYAEMARERIMGTNPTLFAAAPPEGEEGEG